MKGLIVTGTDTGVGKTLVSTSLVELLRERGLRPAPFKPVETGCAKDAPEDALALLAASGGGDALDEVCPLRLLAPLAPAVAAPLEGARVDVEALLRAFHKRGEGDRFVVVESAGGVLVPFDERTTFLDLAVRFGLPALVVARDALGTLNHTALTVQALKNRGVSVKGVVLNAVGPVDDGSRASNAEWIERLCGVKVLARLPYAADAADRRRAALAALGRKFDLLTSAV